MHIYTYPNTTCSKVIHCLHHFAISIATWPQVLTIHVPQKEQRCPRAGHQGETADLVLDGRVGEGKMSNVLVDLHGVWCVFMVLKLLFYQKTRNRQHFEGSFDFEMDGGLVQVWDGSGDVLELCQLWLLQNRGQEVSVLCRRRCSHRDYGWIVLWPYMIQQEHGRTSLQLFQHRDHS